MMKKLWEREPILAMAMELVAVLVALGFLVALH